MLKKTCVTGGLIIAAAGGTLLTGSAAAAQPMGGWGGGCRHFCGSNRDWNGSENVRRSDIRARILNGGNNVAVARNGQRQRQRQQERQQERQRQFNIGDPQQQQMRNGTVTTGQCLAGGGQVLGSPSGQLCSSGSLNGFPVSG